MEPFLEVEFSPESIFGLRPLRVYICLNPDSLKRGGLVDRLKRVSEVRHLDEPEMTVTTISALVDNAPSWAVARRM
jgi:hypothetical protein